MTTSQISDAPTSTRVAPVAVGTALLAAFWIAYGAHHWREIGISLAVLGLGVALVFGWLVPRALRGGAPGGTSLGLGIPALLLVLPVFWSGLPLVLGIGAILTGNAGRSAPARSRMAVAGLVLGALATVAYLAIYIGDGIVAGHAGFLFD